MKVKEMIKLLEANGWEMKRIRGDHRIFKKPGMRANVCVPGSLNEDIRPGTEKAILRDTGLK